MTTLERSISNWILKAVSAYERAAYGQPMPDFILRSSIREAHPGVSFTESDIAVHITAAEENHFICGVTTEVDGKMWNTTPKGKNRVSQIQ